MQKENQEKVEKKRKVRNKFFYLVNYKKIYLFFYYI